MKFIKNIKKRLGIKRFVFLAILCVIVLAVGIFVAARRPSKSSVESVVVGRANIIQEVNMNGTVKPAESVNLSFEKSGKISRVAVAVGDRVVAGQTLVVLDNSELAAQLQSAEASLKAQTAKLDEMKGGTRPEEIQLAETDLDNAKRKATADLQEEYDAALTALQTSAVIGRNALLSLTDIQYAHFLGNSQDSLSVSDAKERAVLTLLGKEGGGRWIREVISQLHGGAFGLVEQAIAAPTQENIDAALRSTLTALQDVKNALFAVPFTSAITSAESTTLSTQKANVNGEVSTLSSKQQAIAVQKVTNTNAIAAAESALALKKAGTVPEQIQAQEAQVESALANVQNIRAQIAKTVLWTPISGIVTKQEAKQGEIVSGSSAVASVISDKNFEIEADIPEVDIAKIAVGETAGVTLDAYGSSSLFAARVVAIDPAETVVEGVSTYKTTFQFAKEDERIRSGMTADVTVRTASRDNVIAIPYRAVQQKQGESFVLVVKNGGKPVERKIQTGIRGSEGLVEVLSGLGEGERIMGIGSEK